MSKNRIVFITLLLLVAGLALVACGDQEDYLIFERDTYCKEKSIAVAQPVDDSEVGMDITSFVVESPENCGLPKLFCVVASVAYKGGPSCVTIK
jgi:hypothetical protein